MQIHQSPTMEKGFLGSHGTGVVRPWVLGCSLISWESHGKQKRLTHGPSMTPASRQRPRRRDFPSGAQVLRCFSDSATLQVSPLRFNLLSIKKMCNRERERDDAPAEETESVQGARIPHGERRRGGGSLVCHLPPGLSPGARSLCSGVSTQRRGDIPAENRVPPKPKYVCAPFYSGRACLCLEGAIRAQGGEPARKGVS